MYTAEAKIIIDKYCDIINEHIQDYIPQANDGQLSVTRAMKYSLMNGGKRLRPILVLEFCKMCGGDVDKAMDYACAIEFIHTYSLIHDDLPCMDDDDVRRGNPSCHKMFGESTALLAGDALLTHAFDAVASSELSSEQNVKAVCLLAQNAGVGGMIGGQVLDLKFEDQEPSISDLVSVHKLKTGALISAACLLGCIAGNGTEEQLQAASRFAYYLGVAFQIKDDILDVTGDEEKLGKPVGSDKDNNKITYVDLVGLNKAGDDVEKLTDMAIKELDKFDNNEFMCALANYLVNREN
ncbi:MAG: polyprenyl synthetase family protein [Eubacterium sp.]